MLNFRKVLALVLVIATLFSFASMASASFEILEDDRYVPEYKVSYYEDEADINYLEAVRVLSYAGILNGYEDGTFKADNNIRRNEMAKMIAVLANAGYDVEDLYATAASFEDVPADDWAASYVAYCAKTGIVAGRSATTFDPNASVTGLETAKMLLVVLGFDAQEQGYVGADWKVNVLRDAKVMGLLENFYVDYNIEAAITREEAANMMLNAMMAPCVVGYLTDSSSLHVTNALVFGDLDEDDVQDFVEYAKVNSYATLKDAMNDETWALYGDVVVSDDVLSGVLFDIYCGIDVDCFGRPGNAWYYVKTNKGNPVLIDELGVFAFEADFSSYDTDVDEIEDFLYDYWKGNWEYYLTVDGDEETYTDLQKLVNDIDCGKGVIVEIYVVENEIYVVEINTYIGKVLKVNMSQGTVTIGGNNKEIKVDNDWGFNAQDVKDETVVLFWICNEDGKASYVHDVEVIEPEVATLTRADVDGKKNHTFIADGETYEYAHTFGEYLGGHFFGSYPEFDDDAGREHDIYTDLNGFVMWTELTENENTEIVVIDGDSWISKGAYWQGGELKYEENTADFVYFEEGAPVKTVETTIDFNEQIGDTDGADVLAWVEYKDAKFTVSGDDEVSMMAAETAYKADKTIYLERNEVKVSGTNTDAQKYLVNNDTQIIVRVPDYFGEEKDAYTYLYFDGIRSIDAKYRADDFQYFLDNQCGLDGSGRYYAYIYVDATYAKEVNHAFILRSAGSSVLMLDNGRIMGGDKYEAIVNGEEAIVVYQEMTDAKQVQQMLNKTGKEVPTMVSSDLVLVGWTLDDIPVWVHPGVSSALLVTTVKDPDLLLSGGVLSWNQGTDTVPNFMGKRMDPDAAIWVATPNKKGEYEAELITQEEFNDYCEEYGWDLLDGYCWVNDGYDETGRQDGLYDYLLVVMNPIED